MKQEPVPVFPEIRHDSTMLKRALHCARCSEFCFLGFGIAGRRDEFLYKGRGATYSRERGKEEMRKLRLKFKLAVVFCVKWGWKVWNWYKKG